MSASNGPGSPQQPLQHLFIDGGKLIEFGHVHPFIDLMDGGIDRTQLDHLGTMTSDEAGIGGAADGGAFRLSAGDGFDRCAHRVDQDAGRGQEGLGAQRPVDVEIQAMLRQQRLGPFPQTRRRAARD